MFTETVRTKSTAVEVAFATRASVDFLLREVEVEQKEDDEYNADTNHAPDMGIGGLCVVQGMSDAKH